MWADNSQRFKSRSVFHKLKRSETKLQRVLGWTRDVRRVPGHLGGCLHCGMVIALNI
jgi:hypothetical protein